MYDAQPLYLGLAMFGAVVLFGLFLAVLTVIGYLAALVRAPETLANEIALTRGAIWEQTEWMQSEDAEDDDDMEECQCT